MSKLLDKDLIVLHSNAGHYSDVFKELGKIMIEKGFANANYIEGLLERESNFPTGVLAETAGIALPHTDSSFVKESKIGLLVLETPIKFGMMGSDGEEVDVKIVFLLGCSEGIQHLQALQKVIELIQDARFVDQILSLKTKDEAYELLNNRLTIQFEEEVK
ncbi:PTS sugar transporter subunit IIA [Peribacillus simplex]|uniref:PTS sugar transporter subunit IIA n=1 Tax=Peribacillus simplex TaxID=1478 RepID=UPI003817AFBD